SRWVSTPETDGDPARALLIKLRAEAVIGPHGVDRELLQLIGHHRAQLETYLEIEQRDFASRELTVAQKLQHAVLRAGIVAEQGWLDWAGEVLPVLQGMDR
ncbi:MAG: PadR family transcriptional regulator, partial [Oxalobacteraceae bacterium]